MIKVHILEHHKMLVDGIYAAIDKSEIAIVYDMTKTLDECWKTLEKRTPDVLITDLNHLIKPDLNIPKNKHKEEHYFYNGVHFCEDVRNKYPHLKIIVLTGYSSWITIRRVLDLGVSGYVLKTSSLYEVVNAVDNVMEGEVYLCEKSTLLLRKEIKEHFFWLTSKEQDLLRLLAEGFTNKEIGEKLYYSLETIKSKRKFLLQKFGGEGSVNMLKKAMQMGLLWEDLVP